MVQGPQQNYDRTLFTLLVGRQKCAIEDCSRFWDHMFKITQNRKKNGPGPSENHDRKLFTLLAGRQKCAIVHCSRFWDHMFKIAQNRQKTGLGVLNNSRSETVHTSGRRAKTVKNNEFSDFLKALDKFFFGF